METLLAEESVLGCMLLFPVETADVYRRLRNEMFSEEPLRRIFEVCQQLRAEGKTPDFVTVQSVLGSAYQKLMLECCETAPSVSRLADYAGIVLEGWRVRELTAVAVEAQLNGGTSEELISRYRAALEQQEAVTAALKEAGTKDFVQAAADYLQSLYEPDRSIKTGWREMDRVMGGLQRKSVVVIAARPGKGKTDFALQMATQVALDHQVNYNSMEMPTSQLLQRVVSRGAKINSIRLRDRDLTEEDRARIAKVLDLQAKCLKINFDEAPRIDAEVVEGKIARYHPAVLFIDHLGLMTAREPKKNQWEEIASTTHELKALAMKHDVCIVELVQLNRATDGRRPTQGDLYGGAAVEQDADVVIALEVEHFEGFLSGEQSTEVTASVLKNRHGAVGELRFAWQPQYHSYTTIENRYGEM